MIVAGIGCRRDCPAETILALIATLHHPIDALAAPQAKCAEPGLQTSARHLGLPLHPISHEALLAVQPLCPTSSLRALEETGIASVAEGCALAAAGPGAKLILPRIANAAATLALAEGDGP